MTNLPPTKLIKDVIDGMLGKDVAVAPTNPLTSADMVGGTLAVYVDDSDRLGAVSGWDLSLAAIVGSAVALMPAGAARDAIADQYVPSNLLDNLSEVSNVLASVFQIPGNPHMRLSQMYQPVNSADNSAVTLLYAPGNRIDLSVDVPGYGSGRLAVSMRY